MMGSGTVLAVGRAKGHRAFGVDLDPLAVLLAGVWTRTVDLSSAKDKAEDVLNRAKFAFERLSSRHAYPIRSDDETCKFIRYWFDDYARRQLASLSFAIRRIHDEAIRDVLWCGFSRLIITKSSGASLAMDLSHSRPHRAFEYAPVKPFNQFISAVSTIVKNCPQSGSGPVGPATVVKKGDARQLDFEDKSIDLVLTSPPYLNAIDYMRCSKFSLVWMGHTISELRAIRGNTVGTEASFELAQKSKWVQALIKQLKLKPILSDRDQALLARYIWDMDQAITEVSRVLKKKGRAVYVVGDSMIRGTFVRNSEIVCAVAEKHGLSMLSKHSRKLPENRRYLPPPKQGQTNSALDGRMRKEVVLEFSK
jgi:DNA modification methylase